MPEITSSAGHLGTGVGRQPKRVDHGRERHEADDREGDEGPEARRLEQPPHRWLVITVREAGEHHREADGRERQHRGPGRHYGASGSPFAPWRRQDGGQEQGERDEVIRFPSD